MFSEINRQQLDTKGYTVVKDVLSTEECDKFIEEYNEWLSKFKNAEWPYSKQSLLHSSVASHFESTWCVRLRSKNVFAGLWKTDKLLSSFDAIAIGRPPEDGVETFAVPDQHWIHTDQGAERVGLHAYQGAVYLEEAAEDDWTFNVVEKSHLYLDEFYKIHPKAGFKSAINNYYHLRDEDMEWFKSKGCQMVRVPVPKGGMVLWDSRLLHANARPIKGRTNSGRWRYVVFVSMTPAIWATKEDLKTKQHAYKEMWCTSHWSSQGVISAQTYDPSSNDGEFSKTIPPSAQTTVAKQLSGVVRYDFHDGQSNGPAWTPTWNKLFEDKDNASNIRIKPNFKFWCFAGILLSGVGLAYIMKKCSF